MSLKRRAEDPRGQSPLNDGGVATRISRQHADVGFDADETPSPFWTRHHIATVIVGLLIVITWSTFSFFEGQTLDIGLAYDGGVEAWKTGHPENIWTWISTPFLAMLMALVSTVLSVEHADAILTGLNVLLSILVFLVVARLLVSKRVPIRLFIPALLALSLFAPLMSSVWWKQFNLIALTLAFLGVLLGRQGKEMVGALAIALSLSIKPILILLPLVLVIRRDSRRLGLWSVALCAGLFMIAQGFLAIRAQDVNTLDPLISLRNFQTKATPEYGWVCNPENFAASSSICLLLGSQSHWGLQRMAGGLIAALFIFGALFAISSRKGMSWETFALASAVSPMVGPIAWSHYQLFLLPLFVLLFVELWRREGALVYKSLFLGTLFLSMMIARPYWTLVGAIPHSVPSGHLAWFLTSMPTIEIETAHPVMLVSQAAQYLLGCAGIKWYSSNRLNSSRNRSGGKNVKQV